MVCCLQTPEKSFTCPTSHTRQYSCFLSRQKRYHTQQHSNHIFISAFPNLFFKFIIYNRNIYIFILFSYLYWLPFFSIPHFFLLFLPSNDLQSGTILLFLFYIIGRTYVRCRFSYYSFPQYLHFSSYYISYLFLIFHPISSY